MANGAVAREGARAGEPEVADAAKPGQGFAAAAAGDSETRDLRNAASNERSGRVVPETHAHGNAGGDRDHILESPAELYADDVAGGVEAKGFRAEFLLDELRDLQVAEGNGHGRGL